MDFFQERLDFCPMVSYNKVTNKKSIWVVLPLNPLQRGRGTLVHPWSC